MRTLALVLAVTSALPGQVVGPPAHPFPRRETVRNLRASGGGGRTERAVQGGLDWLARQQRDEGYFPGSDLRPDLETTCFATLAFLGRAGLAHDPWRAAWRRATLKSLAWLRARQGADGWIRSRTQAPASAWLHGLVTQAMLEAYVLSRDRTLREPAERALSALCRRRRDGAGWGARGRDPLVTGQAVVTLRIAVQSGLDVDRRAIRDGLRVLRGPNRAGLPAAAALFARAYGRRGLLDPDDEALAARLAGHVPGEEGSRDGPLRWLLTSHALYQVGGAPWRRYVRPFRKALEAHQVLDPGAREVRWSPPGPAAEWVRTTALCVLCLEVFYRFERPTGR